MLTFARAGLTITATTVLGAVRFGRAKQDRIIRMSLDVLLQILWALEGLAAEVTLVWLQRNMHANM